MQNAKPSLRGTGRGAGRVRRVTRPARAAGAARASARGHDRRDAILERIYDAILEHRLPPGTKLAEARLAEIFGASRARIREVLARLAHEQVVSLVPQRGAFVARPTTEQAFDVFEARRLIEPAVVARLIERLAPDDLESLRRHQVLEIDARRRRDERAIVRLSGEFHTLLAERAGNSAYLRAMRELSTLTCLIIFLYDAPTATSCRADEHAAIVEAIGRRDVAKASALMLEHLSHIEKSLRLQSARTEVDLEAVFGA
ncbi:MAG: GntR family transcriptional regulator [Lautropia sp.]